ncbi:MAG TPA: hypothetical protein VGT61_04615 [Thermomicrobiales bacterium]|nr:hypothetical protein [Thermomicrobiales bacterium]
MNPSPALRPGARLLAAVAVVLLLLPALSVVTPASAQDVEELGINSSRYIVVDAETGEVYAQRDADKRVAIGSLTKIFTAIEAMDIAPLDTLITTDESDLRDPTNNSIMGITAGEVLSLEELLYGLMLPSGNDAAHAIARSLGYQEGDTDPQQSVDRFMGWINQRVLDMGLTDTHLITPDGWGVPGHYTTAHDLAAFTRYAMEHPFFETLISSAEYTTSEGNTIYNNNRLLGMYDSLVGGKTGYDWDAGWCLVEVAERDGMQMISVTLDGVHENMDWYDDNEVLLEYGFEQRSARIEAPSTWDGSLALFTNPAIAMIDRSTAASGTIGGQPATTSTTGQAALAEGAPDPAAGTTTNIAATDGTTDTTTDVATTDPAVEQQAVPEAAVGASASSGGALERIAQIALVLGLVGLTGLAAFAIYRRSGGTMRPAFAQAASSRTATGTRPLSDPARKISPRSETPSVSRPVKPSPLTDRPVPPSATTDSAQAGKPERSAGGGRPRPPGAQQRSSAASRARQTGTYRVPPERR